MENLLIIYNVCKLNKMDILLLEKEIVSILRQNGYNEEATSLENSEYGATGGEIFDSIINHSIRLKQHKIIYDLIQDKLDIILDYAKQIRRL